MAGAKTSKVLCSAWALARVLACSSIGMSMYACEPRLDLAASRMGLWMFHSGMARFLSFRLKVTHTSGYIVGGRWDLCFLVRRPMTHICPLGGFGRSKEKLVVPVQATDRLRGPWVFHVS